MSESLKKALADARKALNDAKQKRLGASQGIVNKESFGSNKEMPMETKSFLNKFGAKSFDDLCKINTADRKFAYAGKEDLAKVKSLKESVDIAVLVGQIFKMPVAQTKFYKEELSLQLKAFGIGSGSNGYEWIPTLVSESYIDEYNLPRKVSSLFTEVKMPSNPYKWPVLSNGAIARKVGEVTALSPAQVFKTDKTIMFDAVKFTNQYALPEELTEDSAVDMIKVIRQELIEGEEKAFEIAILNGDSAGTMDVHSILPDVTAGTHISAITDSPEMFFNGIRHKLIAASATVNAGGNHLSETYLAQARQKMGKFGVDPSELAIIAGPKVYNQMLQLDDVRTLEQYGPQAPVLSGELAKYEGIAIVVSEWMREDLSSNGKNVDTTDALGGLIMVNRKRWFCGVRRATQIKVENNRTQYDVLDLVSFTRKAFQSVLKDDGSNYAYESSGAYIINIGF